MKLAGDGNAGDFEVGNRGDDLRIMHVSTIVVLIDREDAGVVGIFIVKNAKMLGVERN